MKRTSFVTSSAIAAIAVFLCATPAGASHVQCGDVLTETTALDSDLSCGPDAAALYIGADDVTLWMSGHTIAAAAPGGVGIMNAEEGPAALSGVDIRGGTLVGFEQGVSLTASDSAVRNLAIQTPANASWGINLEGDRNTAYRNFVGAEMLGTAIAILGDDSYAWGNHVTGNPAIGLGLDNLGGAGRPRAVLNKVECDSNVVSLSKTSAIPLDGITVEGTDAVVNSNTVEHCYYTITVVSDGGSRTRLNQVTRGNIGLRVFDETGIVGRNTANGNEVDGIAVFGAIARNNVANNNGRYGIWARDTSSDGGGNSAAGNGYFYHQEAECWQVSCSSP